jgi:hypothetical protein
MVNEIDDVRLKILVLESLRAQRDFLKFLRGVAERHGFEELFNDDEAVEGNMIMKKASDTIDRLSVVIDNCDTLTIASDEKESKPTSRYLVDPKTKDAPMLRAVSRLATVKTVKSHVPTTQKNLKQRSYMGVCYHR